MKESYSNSRKKWLWQKGKHRIVTTGGVEGTESCLR